MKKLISGFLALLILLSFTACAPSVPAATGKPGEPGAEKWDEKENLQIQYPRGAVDCILVQTEDFQITASELWYSEIKYGEDAGKRILTLNCELTNLTDQVLEFRTGDMVREIRPQGETDIVECLSFVCRNWNHLIGDTQDCFLGPRSFTVLKKTDIGIPEEYSFDWYASRTMPCRNIRKTGDVPGTQAP
ncbi:MAG: hypothetical protein II781_05130 [Clostridia bacterium]|nr:hypothetical protein [Clostridia bacterium]